MKKLAALAGVAVIALTPAAADAHSKNKIYRGSFRLVGADGSYTRDSFGKAQLVDGRRNDQLSVHVRKLGSKQKYVFRLQSAATACEQGAAGGTDVPGWTYRRGGLLVTSRRGVANSWARARSFKVDRTVEYFVGVFTRDASGAPDQLVACAQLTKKTKKSRGTPSPKPGKPADPGARGNGAGSSGNGAGSSGNGAGSSGNSGEDHGKSGQDHGKAGEDHGKSNQDHGQGNRNGRGPRG